MVIGTVENPPLHGTVADMLALKGTTIYAVAPDATVYEAIERMDRWRVGALLVMRGEELVGIVSERDYTAKSSCWVGPPRRRWSRKSCRAA